MQIDPKIDLNSTRVELLGYRIRIENNINFARKIQMIYGYILPFIRLYRLQKKAFKIKGLRTQKNTLTHLKNTFLQLIKHIFTVTGKIHIYKKHVFTVTKHR